MRNSVTIPAACRERHCQLTHPAYAPWQRAGIVSSGVSDLVPGYAISNPSPVRIMVIVTVGGRGWIETPSTQFDAVPGTLYIGPPGEPVAWGIRDKAWRLAWWYLQPSTQWSGWQMSAGALFPCPRAALLTELAEDLLDRTAASKTATPLMQDSATVLVRHLDEMTHATAPDAHPHSSPFAVLWDEVTRNPQANWSIPVLAQRLGVSLSTLHRLARAHLGHGVHRGLIDIRLNHARVLLQRTTYPLKVIAELTGYADAFAFSAAYRTWSGHPPSADRSPML